MGYSSGSRAAVSPVQGGIRWSSRRDPAAASRNSVVVMRNVAKTTEYGLGEPTKSWKSTTTTTTTSAFESIDESGNSRSSTPASSVNSSTPSLKAHAGSSSAGRVSSFARTGAAGRTFRSSPPAPAASVEKPAKVPELPPRNPARLARPSHPPFTGFKFATTPYPPTQAHSTNISPSRAPGVRFAPEVGVGNLPLQAVAENSAQQHGQMSQLELPRIRKGNEYIFMREPRQVVPPIEQVSDRLVNAERTRRGSGWRWRGNQGQSTPVLLFKRAYSSLKGQTSRISSLFGHPKSEESSTKLAQAAPRSLPPIVERRRETTGQTEIRNFAASSEPIRLRSALPGVEPFYTRRSKYQSYADEDLACAAPARAELSRQEDPEPKVSLPIIDKPFKKVTGIAVPHFSKPFRPGPC
ncbi:hypothetical protein P389DRAFT_208412 [Cystobasidium minutum MCA 4210]|uniref:uncharacterized protein n=1 Tax=Cystobasidium minutum MCA 4210 TaxID=1397322 RepID=UPI0034CF1672|eukprot:jgi/Rhomi1/208412/estExt_Genemark1.C_2_t10075